MTGSTNAVVIIGYPIEMEFTNTNVNHNVQVSSFTCEEVV